jgi:hypothetical protein
MIKTEPPSPRPAMPTGFRAEDFEEGSVRAIRGERDDDVVMRFGPHSTVAGHVLKDKFPGLNGFENSRSRAPVTASQLLSKSFFIGLTPG